MKAGLFIDSAQLRNHHIIDIWEPILKGMYANSSKLIQIPFR